MKVTSIAFWDQGKLIPAGTPAADLSPRILASVEQNEWLVDADKSADKPDDKKPGDKKPADKKPKAKPDPVVKAEPITPEPIAAEPEAPKAAVAIPPKAKQKRTLNTSAKQSAE
jgi:hypothetical protein